MEYKAITRRLAFKAAAGAALVLLTEKKVNAADPQPFLLAQVAIGQTRFLVQRHHNIDGTGTVSIEYLVSMLDTDWGFDKLHQIFMRVFDGVPNATRFEWHLYDDAGEISQSHWASNGGVQITPWFLFDETIHEHQVYDLTERPPGVTPVRAKVYLEFVRGLAR